MLDEAKRLSQSGRAVYIVAANKHHADQLRYLIDADGEYMGAGYKIPIHVETESSVGNLDWDTMSLRGAHPNCIVLVDHHTIESRFKRVLDMLHRYDA